jgi:predicted dehydrogenase
MNSRKKIGLIGFGRMGAKYLHYLKACPECEVSYICDISESAREYASRLSPDAKVVANEDDIFEDESVDAVALCTLANLRHNQIKKAVAAGKHIISEKPIGDSLEREWDSVNAVESYDKLATVNLYLRSSWYHSLMKQYIDEGELGELAIIRVCHMTPGLAPGEGHEYEGPAFHDCGMHYVDIARWYAGAEFKTWHSQGMRMWNYKDPWWIQCHGTFENGIAFDITQGFVYGQLSKVQTHLSYVDLIGTKGIVRMTHDFKTAVVDLHGVTRTVTTRLPFGGKNIDVMCRRFASSIDAGKLDSRLPTLRDSAIASEYAWKFLENSRQNDLPAIGDLKTLEEIHEYRRNLKDGYGLLNRREF